VRPAELTAAEEAVQRQYAAMELRRKLVEGASALQKGDIFTAAALYRDSVALARLAGPEAAAEGEQARRGLSTTYTELARQANRAGNFTEASNRLAIVLKEDPRNPDALKLAEENERDRLATLGRRPNQEIIDRQAQFTHDRGTNNALVQDAKFLMENGKYDEAKGKLLQAIKNDPDNRAAFAYLQMMVERKYVQEADLREAWSTAMLLDIEKAWNAPIKRDQLPVPNPEARTNRVHTGKGRQMIYSKLDRIRLNTLQFPNVPLSAVVTSLNDEAKKRDPDKKGLNFLISQYADPPPPPPPPPPNPAGIPAPEAAAPEVVDLPQVGIRIETPITDVSLQEALEIIVRAAERPIKYSVEDYAIVFTHRTTEAPQLWTRTFKVDPNTFYQGLQGVSSFSFGATSSGQNGGGQGGTGGTGGGNQGGGNVGGGQGGGQNGQNGQNGQGQIGSTYVGVNLAGGFGFGQQGQQGGGQQGGFGQQGGQGGQQGQGVRFLTEVTEEQLLIPLVKQFFTAAGVDLTTNGRALFFNDRQGILMVRATLQELDIVEQALQVMNAAPPQVTIEAKFAEVNQDDSRALGFEWFLGNVLIDGGKNGLQGGTAPSFVGTPTKANPSGVFPGPGPAPGVPGPNAIPPSSGDNVLTTGLRNSAPALATWTGILTDPQFRVVLHALEQKQGVDLISAPKVTTLSGRQAQIKAVLIQSIVTDLNLGQTQGGTGGNANQNVNAGGAVGSSIQPIVSQIELGPILDVIPSVSADGFTVQMTLIPTLKEFLGYDDPGVFVAQAQSVSGNTVANPLVAPTPLPKFSLRQVVTSAVVWDGQTVVLGGLIAEKVTKIKDKVPFLGDLPIAGRLFRSESSQSQKKNLLMFVTPTIIDPAGNRMHSDEELPFAQNSFPSQGTNVNILQHP
jgi:type II secretory pathway component GspD/PulD (secretin)/tetratricopeptide (TPR) repeat protein